MPISLSEPYVSPVMAPTELPKVTPISNSDTPAMAPISEPMRPVAPPEPATTPVQSPSPVLTPIGGTQMP